MMGRSLYLINPRSEAPSYFGAEVFEHWGYAPAQGIADLAIPTVAALAPEDLEVTLCDEYIQPIDFDLDVDYVGLTGKVTQAGRMIQVADEFRRRGKTVILGGPFASLSPEVLRPHCDVLVRGELEGIAKRFFADLLADRLDEEYEGDRPDLSRSPVPRWDLYPNHRASLGCVQTSRGCPFECEFCDVIQYLGRQQRHKAVDQILAELEALQRHGYRGVFLADDNFTVYRKRAKEVLTALADWNSRQDRPMFFGTQVSIDAARDDELLDLCARAGLTWVFIGIETPNEESLRESRKRQNVGVDLVSQVRRFLDHGIAVAAGMIVGFDHDGPDIFQRQYEFAMSSPIAIFSLGALVAPAATPLYERMASGGRLVEGGAEIAATPWDTNIVPERMTREELFDGLQRLCNNLYHPRAFGERLVHLIESLGPHRGPHQAVVSDRGRDRRRIRVDELGLLRKLMRSGPEEARMWSRISRALEAKPEAGIVAMEAMVRYAQVRCMYEVGSFWEPRLAEGAAAMHAPPGSGPGSPLVSLGRGA
jgi:radical SAM superfamily enzyme YgiQ (UPF0313 family)